MIRALGTVITTSGERKINVAATKPAASWVEEGGELVFTDPSFNQVILDAYKLSVATKVSEELLADNQYDLEGFLIGDRGTRSIAALHELYAGVGQVAFVAKERVDGKLILPEAVQVLKMKGIAAQG